MMDGRSRCLEGMHCRVSPQDSLLAAGEHTSMVCSTIVLSQAAIRQYHNETSLVRHSVTTLVLGFVQGLKGRLDWPVLGLEDCRLLDVGC